MKIQQLLLQTSEQLIAKLSVMKPANCRWSSRKKVTAIEEETEATELLTRLIVKNGDKDRNLFIYVPNRKAPFVVVKER